MHRPVNPRRISISGQEEIFSDFNANNTYDLNNTPAVYNGLLCPVAGDGVWCSRALINVRASLVLSLGDAPNWVPRFDSIFQVGTAETVTVYIADTYNNPPPAGATVTVTAKDNCTVVGKSAFDVFNYPTHGAYFFTFSTSSELKNPPEEGSVEIKLTTPTFTETLIYPCVFQ